MSDQSSSPYLERFQTTRPHESQLAALTRINSDDLLRAFGLDKVQGGRELLYWLTQIPARRFARQVIAFDELVGEKGLQAGGAWLLEQFAPDIVVTGAEHLPRSGPLLIVANHPGLSDTLALFSAIPRDDLLVVAADRPFLRAVPHIARHLLFVREDTNERLGVVRSVTRHLRAGGAVLTFPGGNIEPDPAVLPDAAAALDKWSASVDLFARLADGVAIVPAIVSGVLSARALRHPLTRLRRTQKDREWLGATLQILLPHLRDSTVRLDFGAPVRSSADALAAARSIINSIERQQSL